LGGGGATIGQHICVIAAEYRQVDALRFLRQNGCEWDSLECAAVAALGGHLSVLLRMRANGGDWSGENVEPQLKVDILPSSNGQE